MTEETESALADMMSRPEIRSIMERLEARERESQGIPRTSARNVRIQKGLDRTCYCLAVFTFVISFAMIADNASSSLAPFVGAPLMALLVYGLARLITWTIRGFLE